jgi:hypothetical protein
MFFLHFHADRFRTFDLAKKTSENSMDRRQNQLTKLFPAQDGQILKLVTTK